MRYRPFGQLEWQVSALGFGIMRLPVADEQADQIIEPEATRMVRYAIDHGVNYLDTAYPYHKGESERFLGRALQDGYRDKVRLATKMPCWKIESAADFDRYLDEQLARLEMDSVEFYLLHALDGETWAKMRELDVLGWAERAMADGRFAHLGFSFHDELAVFKEIVDGYDGWTLAQIQYNYMDVDYQAGTEGLRYAASRGLAVVVMEPLRGGQLAKTPPDTVAEVWDSVSRQRTPVDWALQWLWDQPQVSVVLSGMSTMQHVVENVASADRSAPHTLTEDDKALIGRVREAYRDLCPIPCTACQYCMPCPSGVNIPKIFELYNDAIAYDDQRRAMMFYKEMDEEKRAQHCTECGQCEEVCPQSIPIPDWLKKAHEFLCADEEA